MLQAAVISRQGAHEPEGSTAHPGDHTQQCQSSPYPASTTTDTHSKKQKPRHPETQAAHLGNQTGQVEPREAATVPVAPTRTDHWGCKVALLPSPTSSDLPSRSMMMELPRSRENPIRTQGRKGAWKLRSPKKFMRMYGFLRLHTYTSMMVKAWPRKNRLAKSPNSWELQSQGKTSPPCAHLQAAQCALGQETQTRDS